MALNASSQLNSAALGLHCVCYISQSFDPQKMSAAHRRAQSKKEREKAAGEKSTISFFSVSYRAGHYCIVVEPPLLCELRKKYIKCELCCSKKKQRKFSFMLYLSLPRPSCAIHNRSQFFILLFQTKELEAWNVISLSQQHRCCIRRGAKLAASLLLLLTPYCILQCFHEIFHKESVCAFDAVAILSALSRCASIKCVCHLWKST